MSAATNIPEPLAVPVAVTPTPETAEFRQRLGSISRQSAVYFAGTIFTAAAGYFFKVYLARSLGAEALGLYALGMSVVGLLGLINAAGLPSAATRFIAEYQSRGDFRRLGAFLRRSFGLLSFGNLLLGAVLIAMGPWIAVHFYHAPALAPYFWLFALIMLFGVLSTFFGQAMAGYRDVAKRTFITHFIGTPANMILAVILISVGFGLYGYLAAQVASGLLVLVLLGISVWKSTPAEARVHGPKAKMEQEVVAFSATAFGIAGIEFLLGQTDKIVLGYYLEPRRVGVYAVATALVGFVPIALQSVNQIFSPTIAELYATGKHALLQQLYATLTKWILMLTLPLALVMIFLARPLMTIFGKGFESGASVVVIGTIGQLLNCAVGSVGYLLLMSGNQTRLIQIQVWNAALMIGLSLVLVPRLGILGAAIASAVTVITTNLSSLAAVFRTLRLFPYNAGYRKLVPPLFILSAVLAALFVVSPRIHSPWAIALLGLTLAYGSFMGTLLLVGLEPEDRRFATMIWRRLNLLRNGASS